jgi:allophanate hydrolase
VAVVGAHLSGQPLNPQLTERGARLVKSGRTASGYRLYALPDGRPGLIRDPAVNGPGIALEIWAVPEHTFASFVNAIAPPLGIGTLTLDDGLTVKGFLCEAHAATSAAEITHFGGWRRYLAAKA